jgi:tRNA dimethylallyltransferase
MMAPNWNPHAPSSKAIGAAELIAHVRGEMTREDAAQAVTIATRQYAKRQRTWFRKRMKDWHQITMPSTDLSTVFNFQH